MATVVRMPAALAGVTEGAIQTWLASAGQEVAAGDPIAEIETEKAVVEFPAEVGGTLARLLAAEGDNVPVGAPIAVILAPGEGEEDVDAALTAEGAAPVPADAPASEPEAARAPEPAPIAAPEPAIPVASASEPPAAAPVGAGARRFASPIVRRLARERGIDLGRVTGTGPDGRIVRRDLDGYRPEVAPATAPAPTSAAGYTDVPLTGMRRAIARRLTESKTTVPHFYVTAHVRVDALLELRRQANVTAERKISVNDLVLKAVAGALRRVPAANAIWNGDSIRRLEGVDLAIAVAVENGLLTPVIHGVDRLSLGEVAAASADLAERARAGRLQQHELEGGSFSVSNLGMYGVDEFSAILNPPQSGILAVGAAKPRPVVGADGGLEVATVMTVTLSADHRVVDGAVAAEWMAAFVALVENPVAILL